MKMLLSQQISPIAMDNSGLYDLNEGVEHLAQEMAGKDSQLHVVIITNSKNGYQTQLDIRNRSCVTLFCRAINIPFESLSTAYYTPPAWPSHQLIIRRHEKIPLLEDKGGTYVIVDDTVETGNTALCALEALCKQGIPLSNVWLLADTKPSSGDHDLYLDHADKYLTEVNPFMNPNIMKLVNSLPCS